MPQPLQHVCTALIPPRIKGPVTAMSASCQLTPGNDSTCFTCPAQPPRFEFYDPHSPIYTSPRFLPPAKIVKSKVSDAIISHGAYLEECTVENAIVGLRARIGKKTVIRVRRGQAEQQCRRIGPAQQAA